MTTTQKQANEIYELDDFDIADKFTVACKNFSLAIYFAPMLPIAVFYGILTNLAYFYVNKVQYF